MLAPITGLKLCKPAPLTVLVPLDYIKQPRRGNGLHGSVIGVRRNHEVRGRFIGVLDHAEKAHVLGCPINSPRRVEDVVSAVLRVDLGEHEQFNVILHHLESVLD
jgi:hypothetical protein